MRIRDMMTKNPITVESEALVWDAQKIMKENNIRRLPVVDKGKLVGIITKHDLLEASPSPATSLSIFELNYLLSKMKVKDIMKKNPVTDHSGYPFRGGLKLGQEKEDRFVSSGGQRETGWHYHRIGHHQVPDACPRPKGRRVEDHD